MARSPHPKKEVEEALRHAEGQGWRVEVGGNNARALRRVLGSASIWHLADVLTWLQAKGSYSLAKKGHRLPHSTSKELEALVG